MSRTQTIVSGLLAFILLLSLSGSAIAQDCTGTVYTVKAGDWLWRIARSYGLTAQDLINSNPQLFSVYSPNRIYPGQRLCIPARAITPTSPPTPTRTPTSGPSPTPRPTNTPLPPPYTGIPTFRIVSVARDASVTIQTNNFPAGVKFDVRMGAMGTQGVGGTLVTTTDSGRGGSFQMTYTIPPALRGSARIAIRLENLPTGYFAYNWFYNNTFP